jgi:hypothetical protein
MKGLLGFVQRMIMGIAVLVHVERKAFSFAHRNRYGQI